jgi:putative ABC transport system permease protein
MIRNYLTTAFRNILRHKAHTLISIVGLSIGIGTSILMLRYVQHELSYDAFHTKLDRIYRVMEKTRTKTETTHSRFICSALSAALRNDLPEVETAAHVRRIWVRMEANGKTLGGIRVAAAEQELFRILDIPFTVGSVEALFADPTAIAMREKTARRFFGNEDPIGKTVTITSADFGGERVVRALVKDQPNTTLRFDYIQPTKTPGSWTGGRGNTYVLLREGADPNAAGTKLRGIVDQYHSPEIAKKRTYEFYPFSRVYLHMTRDYDMGFVYEAWGDINQVYQFSAIALLVLAISCINFTNLSIARSAARAREVGMRKVSGALRSQLAAQFLSESILIAFLSLGLALIALTFVLPEFNAFFRRRLQLDILSDPSLLLGVLSVTIAVGLMAGAYPAFVLASLQPTDTLKGTYRGNPHGQWIRKGLVVVQFAASIGLIVGSGVIYRQFDYIRSKDLGYSMDGMVHTNIFVADKFLKTSNDIRLADRYVTVKQAFLDHPDALEATAYKQDFGLTTWGKHSVILEGHEGEDWRIPIIEVDDDFIDLMKIDIVAGRKFDGEAFPSDHASAYSDHSVGFILNETAVSHFGWTLEAPPGTADSPIGKSFTWVMRRGDIKGSVIGVTKDFHYLPLTENIGPMALAFRTKSFFNLSIRYREGALDAVVAHMEKTWKSFAPNKPFWHWFWRKDLEQGYRQERRTQALALVASCIAIFLACVGLYGLASHATGERRKEIGVRKTLGATVTSIIILVSREFTVMVLLAAAVAVPVAYTIMRGWLDNFAYRTDLGPEAFVLGATLTLVVAQLTVSYHVWRAATADPVVALRDE